MPRVMAYLALLLAIVGATSAERVAAQTSTIDQLRESAESGDSVAQYKLGVDYRDGAGVPQNPPEAAQWFQRSADACYAPAQVALGEAYETGSGVQHDSREAARYYRLAAAAKDAEGDYRLALAFDQHRAFAEDAPQDKAYAPGCPTLQAASASTSSSSDTLQSYDPARDEASGFQYMLLAAGAGLADAQYAVGQAYELGTSTQRSMGRAIFWYRKAAAQGQPDARAALARLHAIP